MQCDDKCTRYFDLLLLQHHVTRFRSYCSGKQFQCTAYNFRSTATVIDFLNNVKTEKQTFQVIFLREISLQKDITLESNYG